ncbi:hypothetical protein GCM10025780_31990 [Frondihabitans cladoniiphilus]|uniref:Bulb-type lectin domain-containing protein n=1 Tax=Frondihabitans cladoniiphilus TaxID=715785 RepID=A0ABP8W903_9MICO
MTGVALVVACAAGFGGVTAANAETPSLVPSAPTAVPAAMPAVVPPGVLQGNDVSYAQGTVDWKSVAAAGASFSYVKATQGTYAANDSSVFAPQYSGARGAGLIRGAYHFADPLASDGTTQAAYFLQRGGRWSPDSTTLPPMLDLENSTNNGDCFGLTPGAMVKWISDFSNTMLAVNGVRPVIYVTPAWWIECTGNSTAFTSNPLFLVNWTTASDPGPLPGGWTHWTFWQHAASGTFPGDQDYFNGTVASLTALASGGVGAPSVGADGSTSRNTWSGATTVYSGSSISSNNGQYRLTLQGDGNLVAYGNGSATWNTSTSGNPGAFLRLQGDGNAVLYSSSGAVLWNSGAVGIAGASLLSIGNDGDIVNRSAPSGAVTWRAGAPGSNTLQAGASLVAGDYLHTPSGTDVLVLQPDGNLVLYVNGVARWNSGASGNSNSRLVLQGDGNLVLYSSSGAALWFTGTDGNGAGAHLALQTDGNLVLYSASGRALWNTGPHA